MRRRSCSGRSTPAGERDHLGVRVDAQLQGAETRPDGDAPEEREERPIVERQALQQERQVEGVPNRADRLDVEPVLLENVRERLAPEEEEVLAGAPKVLQPLADQA